MGTSTSFGGPNGGTPLVPSWLENGQSPNPDIPLPAEKGRFQGVRSNTTRFAQSGGSDRRSLGRAISGYVGSSGGSKKAAQRMGASTSVGAGIINFFSTVASQGASQTLTIFNLSHLAGKPISEVFLGLAEQVCPLGGTIDEGIARNAFIETIGSLENQGIANIDDLNVDQMSVFFELYVTNSIKLRLCNDVANKIVMIPSNVSAAIDIDAQLFDFIRGGVSAAIKSSQLSISGLSSQSVQEYVEEVYENSFVFLKQLSEIEGDLS